ncbi:50S ribosomal protein L3 [Candidatus Nomurabacteria bacterium RIFCSPHIGHO2_02_FULL_38_15]|uniref:50S ribosomal protein L3 n=1 Tax=Candidatus Nomurabacteria bacterium RIFCSPHIGHO2_02_FULL_38_15 TaxID=1801752 RepID=A0A1F6VS01_9BACT|nr:MAG: 50S ribosomal protein L3 [Candidatus Nomurabacteria bacterium RIFCSPHIGHO2_02_FULL_38_15]
MKFILGTKGEMTQYFGEDGRVYPATIVNAGPITITQIKNSTADGYDAVQYGFGNRNEKNISKSVLGHTKGVTFRTLKELRLDESATKAVGEVVTVDEFAVGDKITVSGTSKGKGFQGVVKRHGFAGGRRSHGQKHSEREHGSIGGGLRNRVPAGTRMGGRMGGDRITVKNLEILAIDNKASQLIIKGAIPGRPGTLLEIVS